MDPIQLGSGFTLSDQKELVHNFLLSMSLNHECVINEDKDDKLNKYQGPSPDEMTLVETADTFEYQYQSTTNSGKIVEIQGKSVHVEVLHFIEFSSA